MKSFLIALFVLAGPLVWGQVGVISVTEEDKHSSKEDFYHTFEYHVEPLKSGGGWKKCQATRIGRRWFATAAHCVLPCMQNGCRIYLDLLEEPVSVAAVTESLPQKPAVFIHPDYRLEVPALDDFALIRLDLNRSGRFYFRRVDGLSLGRQISAGTFNAFLNKNRRAASALRQVMSADLPPILVFDDGTYRIDRKLSVISIFNGVRSIKPDPYSAYYVNDLGFAYTKNFGIRQGMSGSGVMTNTGELAGVVSANLYVESVEVDKKTGKQKPFTNDFFLFAAFNKPLRAFMEEVMGSDYYQLDFKDAYPHYIRRGAKGDHTIIRSIVKEIKQKAAKTQKEAK